jgi:hypothetical protein
MEISHIPGKYLLQPLDEHIRGGIFRHVKATHVAKLRRTREETAMTNRISAELKLELEWLMEDCQITAAEALEQMMKDCDDKHHPSSDFREELRTVGIQFGVYVPVSNKDAEATVCNRKWWAFKRKGIKYEFGSWDKLRQIVDLDLSC